MLWRCQERVWSLTSNVLSIGTEVACRGHLIEVLLKRFPKGKHGLTQQAIDNKDKQNYGSIELLIQPGVAECLNELIVSRSSGTVIYQSMMRDIGDCLFDKLICPLDRLYKIWKAIFFRRIWRKWLSMTENDHFITNNAYLCIQLNGHMLTNLVHNVANGTFPYSHPNLYEYGYAVLRHVRNFFVLRSTTPTFSTIANFSFKGILGKIHKLQFISSCKAYETIPFPRLQRRIFQVKNESARMFEIPAQESIVRKILQSKDDAVCQAIKRGMSLTSWKYRDLVRPRGIQRHLTNDTLPMPRPRGMQSHLTN